MSDDEWTDEQYRSHARNGLRRAVIVGLFLGPVSAIVHAFRGGGEDTFGEALLLVLLASTIGALIGLVAGGAGSYLGTYWAKHEDRKRRR